MVIIKISSCLTIVIKRRLFFTVHMIQREPMVRLIPNLEWMFYACIILIWMDGFWFEWAEHFLQSKNFIFPLLKAFFTINFLVKNFLVVQIKIHSFIWELYMYRTSSPNFGSIKPLVLFESCGQWKTVYPL